MKKLIVYFHGYRSNPGSDKVERLKAVKNSQVFAFNIDVNPDTAFVKVGDAIDDVLMDHLNEPIELILVGTSLGAWHAANHAKAYGCPCVLINPCYAPAKLLPEAETMRDMYQPIPQVDGAKYWFAADDEVIPNQDFRAALNPDDVTVVEGADHRFNGPEFDAVIEYIDNM